VTKKYLNISDVSKILGIEEHRIRYWDSIDPKTKKKRVENISITSKGGTRYFSSENIKKLKKLKNILYEGQSQNNVLKLANYILTFKDNTNFKISDKNTEIFNNYEKSEKINQILNKMKILVKK
tara:strand:- start:366 stop:737 length:372 start_codon:yes stop_codon:yes gene_type:complete